MKKILMSVVLVCTILIARSQSVPFGLRTDFIPDSPLQTLELSTFDHTVLLAEDTRIEEEGGLTNNGRIVFMDIDANSAGTWSQLPNGDKIWQLKYRTPNALATCVFFDDFQIPVGSTFYIYPSDRSSFDGPYDYKDCMPQGYFGTMEVMGEEAIIEYYQPASVVGQAKLGIKGFGHFYRYVSDYSANRGGSVSGACQVDVNCPEGVGREDQRDAVVRLRIVNGNSAGLCSGSLVNTTAFDCRNYVLTAMHCGFDVNGNFISDADLLLCQVRFNYEKSGCNSGSTTATHNKTGVVRLADSADGGGDSGSDFFLVEMTGAVPASFEPFYAGWDATGLVPQNAFGIHHPSGDVKKISYTEDIVSGTWQAAGNHWEVQWAPTTTSWGVTEGGSSGSPLFNQNKRLVGTLTGGASFCNAPSQHDLYGKMSKHWSGNPNAASQKLKVWLDPQNTGITTLDGARPNSSLNLPCNSVGVQETIAFNEITIFPTLAETFVTINTSRFREIKEVKLFNSMGVLVEVFNLQGQQSELNLSSLPAGIYYLSFIQLNGNFLTKKITVIR
jgi:hypothetical protein